MEDDALLEAAVVAFLIEEVLRTLQRRSEKTEPAEAVRSAFSPATRS